MDQYNTHLCIKHIFSHHKAFAILALPFYICLYILLINVQRTELADVYIKGYDLLPRDPVKAAKYRAMQKAYSAS